MVEYGTIVAGPDAVPDGYSFAHAWDGYVRRNGYEGYQYAPRQTYARRADGKIVSIEGAGCRVWNPVDCGFTPDTPCRVLSRHGLRIHGLDG